VTWLGFFEAVVGHLAWPLVIIFVFWRFKKEVGQLFAYLSHVKIGNVEMSFNQVISDISETLEQDIPAPPEENANFREYEEFERISSFSPRGAVLDSWRELEVRISRKYSEFGNEGRLPPPRNLAKQALNDGTFNQDQFDAFSKLRSLRNEAAHNIDFNISASDARSYVRSVERLSSRLET
jgi:hypothetical protein